MRRGSLKREISTCINYLICIKCALFRIDRPSIMLIYCLFMRLPIMLLNLKKLRRIVENCIWKCRYSRRFRSILSDLSMSQPKMLNCLRFLCKIPGYRSIYEGAHLRKSSGDPIIRPIVSPYYKMRGLSGRW